MDVLCSIPWPNCLQTILKRPKVIPRDAVSCAPNLEIYESQYISRYPVWATHPAAMASGNKSQQPRAGLRYWLLGMGVLRSIPRANFQCFIQKFPVLNSPAMGRIAFNFTFLSSLFVCLNGHPSQEEGKLISCH